MDFYINEFDKNGTLQDIIDLSTKNVLFYLYNDNLVAYLQDGSYYSFPILDSFSEIAYQGAEQEKFILNKKNIKKHIDFLNFTMKNYPEVFNIIGIVFSNTSIKKVLKMDIGFKNNLLPQIIFPKFSDPIIS